MQEYDYSLPLLCTSWIPIISYFNVHPLLFQFEINRIYFREFKPLKVYCLLLWDIFNFQLASSSYLILLFSHLTPIPFHGLYCNQTLLLIWIILFQLLQVLIELLGCLALGVWINLSHFIEYLFDSIQIQTFSLINAGWLLLFVQTLILNLLFLLNLFL